MPRFRRLAALLPALLLTAAPAAAQGFLSLGVGGGTGVGRRNGPTADASHAHGQAYVQLSVPLIPIAVRADALVLGSGTAGRPLSLGASAVFSLPIPIATVYATVGYGRYGIRGSGSGVALDGWVGGIGARAKLPLLPGLFVEARRHQRLGRDLATVGLIF